MTREEAKEFIAQSVKSDVDMALVADAIKALEQEPKRETLLDQVEDGQNTIKDYKEFIDKLTENIPTWKLILIDKLTDFKVWFWLKTHKIE